MSNNFIKFEVPQVPHRKFRIFAQLAMRPIAEQVPHFYGKFRSWHQEKQLSRQSLHSLRQVPHFVKNHKIEFEVPHLIGLLLIWLNSLFEVSQV